MRLVVADTGPLNYRVLIGASDILPRLFATVVVPEAVRAELCHPRTPASVRAWAMRPPAWIDVRPVPAAAFDDPVLHRGLIDIGDALTKLRATNFRYRPEIMDALLAQHRREDGG